MTGAERVKVEKSRGDRLAHIAEQERQQAEPERQRAEKAEQTRRNAIPKLLATGTTVEQVAQILSLTVEEVKEISS